VRTIGKSLQTIATVQGTWKENTDILEPRIILDNRSMEGINYCYIPEFGRYYYIDDHAKLTGGMIEIMCAVDVLESWKPYIKQLPAIVARQENQWNLYLNDEMFKAYQNPNIQTKTFPNGFTTQEFVLVVAGGD
jgi:hypothetical protein